MEHSYSLNIKNSYNDKELLQQFKEVELLSNEDNILSKLLLMLF